MPQATHCDGCALDHLALDQDCLISAEIDIGRAEFVDALVNALAIMKCQENSHLSFDLSGQVAVGVHQQAFNRLVPRVLPRA
jgi:hypothetical protein